MPAPIQIEIRPMAAADVDAVAKLDEESRGIAHWQRSDYERAVAMGSGIKCWVADAYGRVVGFLAARTTFGETEILNVAVSGIQRRRGIGMKLLSERLHAAGTNVVFLEVRESNLAARAFYEKMGFRESGRRPNYYSDPAEAALILRRDAAHR